MQYGMIHVAAHKALILIKQCLLSIKAAFCEMFVIAFTIWNDT